MAAEALLDLHQALSSQEVKLTPQEANVLLSWKSKLVNYLTAGVVAGNLATWAATWKLSKEYRISLSTGVGVYCGMWLVRRTLYTCTDQILTMDGSILQKELANIMVTKYQNDPSLMQLLSKHFYIERTFDDSSNNPKLRWRYRNFFTENPVLDQKLHDHESSDKSRDHSDNDFNDKSQDWSENVTNAFTNGGSDMTSEVEPLECLFGYAPTVEVTLHSNSPNKPPGTQNRAYRRSHRRRRMRNNEDLSNSDPAAV